MTQDCLAAVHLICPPFKILLSSELGGPSIVGTQQFLQIFLRLFSTCISSIFMYKLYVATAAVMRGVGLSSIKI